MARATTRLIRALGLASVLLVDGCFAQLAPAAPRPDQPRFWAAGEARLGRPAAALIVNINDSPRIEEPAHYATFLKDHAAQVEKWAGDTLLRINPNLIAALVAKESGFDPMAMSHVPAYGIAQITHIADLDLVEISRAAPAFRWMLPEVESWPRMKAVHDPAARRATIQGLIGAGTVTPANEYLFNPATALRASTFWLRVLATIWTEDEWPGMHGSLARRALGTGEGGGLRESDLLDVVIVSYNQGHPYVAELLRKHGRDWTRHLNEESSDYLERIRVYTVIFQKAAG